MRYYKIIKNNILTAITTCSKELEPYSGCIEISEDEYTSLMEEVQKKANFVDLICSGEIILEDVPFEWQYEVRQMVEERKLLNESSGAEEISPEELLEMLEEIV